MAERDIITREKVSFNGILNFTGLYFFAWNWFKDELYGVDELRYSEKVSGTTKDLDIEWKASKLISDYFKIEHRVIYEIRDLADVEVEIDGKKKKMNKGKVSAEIRTALVRDPESKMDRSALLKFLREVYSKYVVPGRIEDMKIKSQNDAQTFSEELKAYLELIGKR